MSDAWTRHALPNGRRSLLCHGTVWVTVQADDGGVRIGERGTVGYWCDPNGIALGHEANRHGCPTPIADDLAWLRGE